MVKFLLDTPAAFIQGVASQVYNMEGIHDCPCVGEFFGGGVKPGVSIHRDDLDALTPLIGARGQPGFEDLLGAALGIMSKSREGPRRSRIGVKSKMPVTYLS